MERSKSKIEHNIITINNKKTNLNRIDDECVSQRWIPPYFEIVLVIKHIENTFIKSSWS